MSEQLNTWLRADQAFPEAEAVSEARLVACLGSVALRSQVGVELIQEGDASTLLYASQMAALGDQDADRAVWTNVVTDVAERLYKVHRSKVQLEFKNDQIEQNGRRLVDINLNTLKHTVLNDEMRRRTTYNLKNVFTIEELAARGILNDYDALILSPSSTVMTDAEKRKYGMFVETDSCSLQLFSLVGNQLTLETALVAGKSTPESQRHDMRALVATASKHGVSLSGTDGTEMLQHVVLVPKTGNPDKLTPIIQDYDAACGGTFYGQQAVGDYESYLDLCMRREQEFSSVVELVKQQLISEVGTFKTPLDAFMRLDELSEKYCVEFALTHHDINTAVFGKASAMHLEEARFFMQHGEQERASRSLQLAVDTADSGSCPFLKEFQNSSDSDGDKDTSSEQKDGKKWMSCPFCSARVYGDPCATKLSCWDCKASVVHGKVVSKGDGGSRSRATKAERKQFAWAA